MDDSPYEALIHKLKAVLAEMDRRPPQHAEARSDGEADGEDAPGSVSAARGQPAVKRMVEP